jgi:nitrate/nitrite sensing protein/histidine kinase/DNA gyrase B/HSP90-like ATPase
MRIRNSRLRTKIIALLLSLTALWAFAAWVTLREGVNLLWVATLDQGIAQPGDTLLFELQDERRVSAVFLATPGDAARRALDVQRARTDRALSQFQQKANRGAVRRAASEALEQRIAETFTQLRELPVTRRAVDTRLTSRDQAFSTFQVFNDSIAAMFRTYEAMATLDDEKFAADTRTLIRLNQSRELLSQQDALLAGTLATGRFTASDQLQLAQLVGARRYQYTTTMRDLRTADPLAYEQVLNHPQQGPVASFEDQLLILRTQPNARPPITAEQWQLTAAPLLADWVKIGRVAGDRLVERAKPIATWVVVRLMLAGGLGLLAVIASVVVSITTARALVRQLEKLRGAAWELAERRLPAVVDRLGRGENVDVATEAPPLEFGSDEIGQVGRAFNAVQETAIRTAVEQAALRRGIRDILLSLARRTQTLVNRQLNLLDQMERRELDVKELEDLFRLDHLATRMRRNAENLIVLSGAAPARGWRRPVPMIDVVRAAVAEVEDYSRVTVLPFGNEGLSGRAVGDVTHLLAELIENAVAFSPPYTTVQVGGQLVASGYAVEIEDRGLGMTPERLAEINTRIADPPEFNLAGSVQLGLYVVGRLAERYGVEIQLKRSPYGGTTAVVLIPRDLVVIGDEQQPEEPAVTATAAPALDQAVGASSEAGGVAVLQPVQAQVSGPLPVASAERPAVPAVPPPAPEATHTPGGLPMRVPQANLVPALRKDGAQPAGGKGTTDATDTAEEEADLRSPEDIRRMVGAYQMGTRQGRSMARTLGSEADGRPDNAPRDAEPGDEGPPR